MRVVGVGRVERNRRRVERNRRAQGRTQLSSQLQGAFLSDEWATMLTKRVIGGRSAEDRALLPAVARTWKMDLLGVRLSDGTPMWEAMTTELWPRRHAFVHAGEPVDDATASRALETVDVMVSGFLQPLAHRFRMSWPARSWHNVYFRDPATGNAFGRSYEPDSPFR